MKNNQRSPILWSIPKNQTVFILFQPEETQRSRSKCTVNSHIFTGILKQLLGH